MTSQQDPAELPTWSSILSDQLSVLRDIYVLVRAYLIIGVFYFGRLFATEDTQPRCEVSLRCVAILRWRPRKGQGIFQPLAYCDAVAAFDRLKDDLESWRTVDGESLMLKDEDVRCNPMFLRAYATLYGPPGTWVDLLTPWHKSLECVARCPGAWETAPRSEWMLDWKELATCIPLKEIGCKIIWQTLFELPECEVLASVETLNHDLMAAIEADSGLCWEMCRPRRRGRDWEADMFLLLPCSPRSLVPKLIQRVHDCVDVQNERDDCLRRYSNAMSPDPIRIRLGWMDYLWLKFAGM